MKILALEKELPNVSPEQFAPHLKAEAARVWELYQVGQVREIYFRADRREAVLVLECVDVEEAKRLLATLPLVQAGLIAFEVIPLVPYPGFERLFGKEQLS
ncbi:MAG: muconolactone Delta-isomerase family protein [Chloroflexota bacterium]